MGVNKFLGLVLVMTASGAACTKTVNECSSDSDCKDVAYPFCDVNGEFGPSGGAKNVCTITPPDCPIERCGCSPGATTCDGVQLTTCNTDGMSTTVSTCALGCADSKDHCLAFDPTNGLGAAMKAAAGEPDATFNGAVTIDTDSGQIKNSANVILPVSSLVVSPGDIRVFIANSFSIADAVISGGKPVAFVAPGAIHIVGIVDASANFEAAGPGAMNSGSCVGQVDAGNAGGGGGNATPGGYGAYRFGTTPADYPAGGTLQTGFSLTGGCRGGGTTAGGGGGAIQLDSLTSIDVGMNAVIDVGGGGARQNLGGGGSGGNLVFEAPLVTVLGSIFANGGAGSACGVDGVDGLRGTTAAIAPTCTHSVGGGNGATVVDAPGAASTLGDGGGGGGGAVGRLRVATSDGTMSRGSNAVLSIVPTYDTLVLK